MATTADVEVLSEAECWDLLLSSSLGRLAVSVGGEPDIFPVNFVATDNRLVFRTAQGKKLLELTVNSLVAFETDGVGTDQAWSVVVKGTARVLERQSEIDEADQLPLRPLIPTLKYIYVEVTPQHVSGRRFPIGPEPDRQRQL
jgi:nitroimidazol reductase NimA-like FMN-containing flavoprotein (pyridoxamine 5'-phosphate oxidase superfamily)